MADSNRHVGSHSPSSNLLIAIFLCIRATTTVVKIGKTTQFLACAFNQVSRVVARIAGAADTNGLSIACWCIVHGYTTQCNEIRLETPERRLARANTFARIIEADIAARWLSSGVSPDRSVDIDHSLCLLKGFAKLALAEVWLKLTPVPCFARGNC